MSAPATITLSAATVNKTLDVASGVYLLLLILSIFVKKTLADRAESSNTTTK